MSDKSSNKSNETTFRKRWRGLTANVVAMVCVTLMLAQASSTLAQSATDYIVDYDYEVVQRVFGEIIPGASFAKCDKLERPAKCMSNRADLIKAVAVLSRLSTMQFGYKSPLKKGEYLSFFQTDFIELLFCFRQNCNFGLELKGTSPEEAYKTWLSLGQYLQCRYVAYKSFAKTGLGNLPDAIREKKQRSKNLKVDRMAREVCLGLDFPQHLVGFINEVHTIRENAKF